MSNSSMKVFLESLIGQGVQLWVEDEKLKIKAPEGILNTQHIKHLKVNKSAIIDYLTCQNASDQKEISGSPVSYSQKALWSLYSLSPKNPAFNLLFACKLPKDTLLKAFEHACVQVVQRHQQLRTIFFEADNEVLQASVNPTSNRTTNLLKTLTFDKLSNTEIESLIAEKADEPFDLTKSSRRFFLIENNIDGETEYYFVLALHHIVADFWSCQLMLGELSLFYHSIVERKDVTLPNINHEYTEFVSWQDNLITGDTGKAHWHYWKNLLSGELPILNLPKDKPRPEVMTFRGGMFRLPVNKVLATQIKHYAQSLGVTPSSALMAAFFIFLNRYTGQSDLLVGTPTASRPLTGFEWSIGDFSNPIIVRNQIHDNLCFDNVARKTQQGLLEGIRHQDYPFSLLVEKLNPVRDTRLPPLIQAMFLWHQPNEKLLESVIGTKHSVLHDVLSLSGQRGATYDVMLSMFDSNEALICNWGYNSDIFHPETIERMAQHFVQMLEQLILNPREPVRNTQLEDACQIHPLIADIESDSQSDTYSLAPCYLNIIKQRLLESPSKTILRICGSDSTAIDLTNKDLSTLMTVMTHQITHTLDINNVHVGITLDNPIEAVLLSIVTNNLGKTFTLLPECNSEPLAIRLLKECKIDSVIQTNSQDSVWSIIAKNTVCKVLSFDSGLTDRKYYDEKAATQPTTAFTASSHIEALQPHDTVCIDLIDGNNNPILKQTFNERIATFCSQFIGTQKNRGYSINQHPHIILLEIVSCLYSGTELTFNVAAQSEKDHDSFLHYAKNRIDSGLADWLLLTEDDAIQLWEYYRLENQTFPDSTRLIVQTPPIGESAFSHYLSIHSPLDRMDAKNLNLQYYLPELGREILSQRFSATNSPLPPTPLVGYTERSTPLGQKQPSNLWNSLSFFPKEIGDGYPVGLLVRQRTSPQSKKRAQRSQVLLFKTRSDVVINQGLPVQIPALINRILEYPAIADATGGCHPYNRHPTKYDVSAGTGWVLYISLRDSVNWQDIQDAVESILPYHLHPNAIAQVSSIPRYCDGSPRLQALHQLEIINSDTLVQRQQRLLSDPDIQAVAVTQQPTQIPINRLHMRENIPLPSRFSDEITHPIARPNNEKTKDTTSRLAFIGNEKFQASDYQSSVDKTLSSQPEHPTDENNEFGSLADVLRYTAETSSDHGILYLEGQQSQQFQSYPELYEEAQSLSAGLQHNGLAQREPVFIIHNNNKALITSFWACLLGGYIPVPVFIKEGIPNTASINRISDAIQLLESSTILTCDNIEECLHSSLTSVNVLSATSIFRNSSNTSDVHSTESYQIQADETAIILLTSGSTGQPKAVEQTHKALLSRCQGTAYKLSLCKKDKSLNWMPLDHVGGIVMFHLLDVYLGTEQIQVSTEYVLESPNVWLDLLSEHQVSVSWAPNFAYGLVNEAVGIINQDDNSANWDLSKVRHLINGGETVVNETCYRFISLLSPHKLSETAIVPAWGMSETCSGVLFNTHYAPRLPVSVGTPIDGTEIRIVDDNYNTLPEGVVGHLQIRGPSVTQGYRNNSTENKSAFNLGWFSVGDRALIINGEVIITGREKESIIIHGVNHYSHDIESSLNNLDRIHTGECAAIAVRSNESESDELVIFFTPTDSAGVISQDNSKIRDLMQSIRRTLIEKNGVNPSYMIPLPINGIPKTSIGKIQHKKLRQQLITGHYEKDLRIAEILTEASNTLPDFFYQWTWQAILSIQPTINTVEKRSVVIIGANKTLCNSLNDHASVYSHTPLSYEDKQEYQTFFDSLKESFITGAEVIYCEPLAVKKIDPSNITDIFEETLNELNRFVIFVNALDSFASNYRLKTPVKVTIVTCNAIQIDNDKEINKISSALPGLVQSSQYELDTLNIRLIDIDSHTNDHKDTLTFALNNTHKESEVALRNRQVLRPRLQKITPQPLPKIATSTPNNSLTSGFASGVYIIIGGAGGIGTKLLQHLRKQPNIKLIIIGRSKSKNIASNNISENPSRNRKLNLIIQRDSESITYQCADIDRITLLEDAISKGLTQLNKSEHDIRGVFNLAGTILEKPLLTLDKNTLEQALSAKILGTQNIQKYLETLPQITDVYHFSSVNGLFGGSQVSSYAAANRFQQTFSLAQQQRFRDKQHQVRQHLISWSMWRQLGMSSSYQGEKIKLSARRGYLPITAQQGLNALDLVIHQGGSHWVIGLDSRQPAIAHRIENLCYPSYRVVNYVAPNDTRKIPTIAQKIGMQWSHNTNNIIPSIDTYFVESIPHTSSGDIDWLLLAQGSTKDQPNLEQISPRTSIEKTLHAIWQKVLSTGDFGVLDNFFDIGGHSLSATQVISRIREQFDITLPVASIFESPTIADLAARIEKSTNQHQDSSQQITQIDRQERLPLSFAQQRLLFLQTLEGPSSTFNVPFALKLEGSLDITLFEKAIDTIISRHEIFRSCFKNEDGDPHVIINAQHPYTLEVIDFSSQETGIELVHQAFEKDALTPFDLSTAPLFRLKLYQLEENRYVLITNSHHIISDGWSVGVFMKELVTLYGAYLTGISPLLQEITAQYVDFAHWQKNWLETETVKQQVKYWQQQLTGLPPLLELDTDKPRPPILRYQGSEEHFIIPADVLGKLEKICREEDVTLYMLLLAALNIVLNRYSRQDDIAVGSPVANRTHHQTEPLIGLFVNTLVMRNSIDEQQPFNEFLAQVKATALEAYAHQEAPFDQVVDAVQPQRSLSHSPLFQVMFILQNSPMGDLDLLGLKLSPLERKSSIAKYDLTLQFMEFNGELRGALEFNIDLFEQNTIQRITQQYRILLDDIIGNRQQTIAELNILDHLTKKRVLDTWNLTKKEFDFSQSVVHRFEQHVKTSPHAIALVFDDERISYQALSLRSQKVASQLSMKGVGPDNLVAVVMDRCTDMVAALFAIMRIGAAYIPIDPQYPKDRVQYMLSHSQPQAIVTQKNWTDLLDLSKDNTLVLGTSCTNETLDVSPHKSIHIANQDLAYVIYTSGSTGKPKGVKIHHEALLNLLLHFSDELALKAGQRWLAVTSLSFDIAALELFLPLISGASVVLATKEQAMDGNWLANQLDHCDIDYVQATPATWQLLTSSSWQGNEQLTALCGGEALTQKLASAVNSNVGELINVYGPTETTIWSLSHKIAKDLSTPISIGKAIANTQLYILDSNLQPTPIGVAGELHIGGLGVGQGYLFQEELSHERFIDSPFQHGATLYKTGDLVRYLSDGNIEFIGRMDHQVKVRGFRVELGEVESALLAEPTVNNAVAIIKQQEAEGASILLAYVTPTLPLTNGKTIDIKTLRTFISNQLPHYMIPTHIIELEAFPLTPNGKIDRKALPAPNDANTVAQRDFIGARDLMELKLLHIWESVLDTRPISITDNFFDLGGHSILAMKLIARIQSEFDKAIPMALLFQATTVEQFANFLRLNPSNKSSQSQGPIVCIKPGKEGVTPLFLVHPVGGSVYCYHELSSELSDDQPVYGLQLSLEEDNGPYRTQVKEMATRYIEAIEVMTGEESTIIGGWSLGGIIAFEMARQLEAKGRPPRNLVLIDSASPDSYEIVDVLDSVNLLVIMALELGLQIQQLALPRLVDVSANDGLRYLLDLCQDQGLLPETFTAENLKSRYNLMQSNQDAQKDYANHIANYAGSITVFRAEQQLSIREETVYLGWKPHAPLIEAYDIPGDHFSLIRQPFVETLGKRLTSLLEQTEKGGNA